MLAFAVEIAFSCILAPERVRLNSGYGSNLELPLCGILKQKVGLKTVPCL